MSYIFLGKFVEEYMNAVFWNLKRIRNGLGHVFDEFLLFVRGSSRKQTNLNGWHLLVLLKLDFEFGVMGSELTSSENYSLRTPN